MPEQALINTSPTSSDEVLRLLIPGSLCDARLFAPLCSHWPKARQVQCASLHPLQDPMDWWRAQLDHLPHRFDVIGFSLGGLLAQCLLRLAPERVRSVVLIASSADAASPTHLERWQAQQTQWHQLGPRALAQKMAQLPSPSLSAAHIELLQDMAHSTPEASFMAQGQFNASRPSGLPVLSTNASPLCLISGMSDPWCTPAVQAQMQQIRPDAHHQQVAQSGHYLPLEAPAEVAQCIEQFLSSISPSKPTP